MSSDDQFTALGSSNGPTAVGFQTNSSSIDVGADISGNKAGIRGHCSSKTNEIVVAVEGISDTGNNPGENDNGIGVKGSGPLAGVQGIGLSPFQMSFSTGTGVEGSSPSGTGVNGSSQSGTGVVGSSQTGVGVHGESQATDGIVGFSHASGHSGVWGNNDQGGTGIAGSSTSGVGVRGNSNSGTGVYGESQKADGVKGVTTTNQHAGVSAVNWSGGSGLWAGGTPAGHFEGDVQINGNLKLTGVKNFVQDHPTDPTKEIVYTALEGGEAGTYIRGTAKLVNGKAVIELPEHFSLATDQEGLTIHLTPRGQWLQLYVVELDTRQSVVREAQGKSGEFDYSILGIRQGYQHHQVIRTKK